MQIVWTIGMIVMFILSLVLLIRSEVLRSREIRNLKDRLEKLEHPFRGLWERHNLQARISDLEANSTVYLLPYKIIPMKTVVLLLLQHLGLSVKCQQAEASLVKLKRKKSK